MVSFGSSGNASSCEVWCEELLLLGEEGQGIEGRDGKTAAVVAAGGRGEVELRDVRTSCGLDSVISTSETEGGTEARTEVAELDTKSVTGSQVRH